MDKEIDNWMVIALLGVIVIGLIGYIGWLEQSNEVHSVVCEYYGWMSEYKDICIGEM